jgi:hypothetical protein
MNFSRFSRRFAATAAAAAFAFAGLGLTAAAPASADSSPRATTGYTLTTDAGILGCAQGIVTHGGMCG